MKTCVCKHCGTLFEARAQMYCCDNCKQIDDEQFEKIKAYLEKYPNSNAIQIAQGLDIPTMEVVSYIDEGRLVINNGSFKML